MSTIKSSTTTTTAYQVVADTTGTLILQTGATPTTAVTVGTDQSVTLAGALTVNGNTTLGDASTDTILMTGAPSIGGAGLGMGMGFRNRLINGALGIWQRGTSFSGTGYAADRWQCNFGTGVTTSQSSDVPSSAFQYSISLAGSNFLTLAQRIESRNSFDLVGQSVTISFWLKQTSGAGSNSIGLQLYFPTASDNFASQTQIGSTVNISATSSWVQYTTTFTSLPSGVANGLGLQIYSNAAGSATYLVTGVQLEKGSTATSFDYRPYGTELNLCERYYQSGFFHYFAANLSSGDATLIFPVNFRTNPTSYAFYDDLNAVSKYTDSTGNGQAYAIDASSVQAKQWVVQTILARPAAWAQFKWVASAEL